MPLAVITGTTRGLGHALASVFTASDWTVLEVTRPRFDLASLDLEKIRQCLSEQVGVDRALLIHNAATIDLRRASNLSADLVRRHVEVNITAAINLTSEFLRAFPSGEIVHLSSGAASRGLPHWGLYCASKAALESFLRACAAEGVPCLSLDPGVMDTGMQRDIRNADFPGVEAFRALKTGNRLQSPASVARAVYERCAGHQSLGLVGASVREPVSVIPPP